MAALRSVGAPFLEVPTAMLDGGTGQPDLVGVKLDGFKALQSVLVYDSVIGSAVLEVKNNVEPECHSLLRAGTWGHYALAPFGQQSQLPCCWPSALLA